MKEKRSLLVQFRLTESEYKQVVECSGDLDVHDYARRMALLGIRMRLNLDVPKVIEGTFHSVTTEPANGDASTASEVSKYAVGK